VTGGPSEPVIPAFVILRSEATKDLSLERKRSFAEPVLSGAKGSG